MATLFHATTNAIDGSLIPPGDSLHERDVPPARMNMEIFNSLPPFRQEMVCPSIRMRSRGAWALFMAGQLCRLAKIDELRFLGGDTAAPTGRCIAILADDEDDAPGTPYVAQHGFLLDEDAMQKANKGIDRLFAWSAANLDTLAADDLMGYFAFKDKIGDAIQNPTLFAKLTVAPAGISIVSVTDQIDGHEDGEGPWYFYSWLRSVQQVIKTALLFRQQVLHIVDNVD